MPEGISSNLEQEIALLEQEIAAKRAELEKKSGMAVESKEVLRHVVAEKIGGEGAIPKARPPEPAKVGSSGAVTSYLDALDPDSVAKVNDLIAQVSERGIARTIEEAKKQEPFILDAFHDALVDKLHEELKARGIIR